MVRIVSRDRPTAREPEEPDPLHTVVASFPLLIVVIDEDGRVRQAVGPLLEASRLRGQLAVGRSLFEVPGDDPEFLACARRALGGQEPPLGPSVWPGVPVDVRWRTLRDEAGRVTGAAAVALEVPPSRSFDVQAARAVEQLPAAMWVTDRELRVTTVSGRAAALLQDCLGRRVDEVAGASALEAHHAALRGASGRYRLTRHGRQLEAHVSPLLDAEGRAAGCVGLAIDVTEPEALLSLLRATIESTHDGILVVDLAGKIVTYNQRFREIWRLPDHVLRAGEEARVLDCATAGVKDPVAFRRRVQELYDRPEEEAFDLIELADGRILERYSRPQRLDGQVVGRVWSFHDITRRHLAELQRAELLEAERRARARAEEEERRRRALVDGVDAILWERPAGSEDFSYVSDGGPAILGYPAERWREPGFWRAAVLPEDHACALAVCQLPWPDAAPRRLQYRARHADGRVRWVQDHVTLVTDEQVRVTHTRGVIIDITARKVAEEALAVSEARLRALVENTPDVSIQGYDEQGQVLSWNRASERLFGFSREEAIGRTLADIGFFDAEQHATFVGWLREVARTGGAVGPVELSCRHRDGHEKVIQSTIFATPGPSEPHLFCMDVDLTRRRAAEAALAAHASRLEVLARASRRLDDARLDQRALARALVEVLSDALGEACVAVVRGEQEGDPDAVEAHPDTAEVRAVAARAQRREGPWGQVAATATSKLVEPGDLPPGQTCAFVAPIVARGEVLGTLTVVRPARHGPCDEASRRLVEELAERAGLAIATARLYGAAERAIRQRDEFLSVASHELRTPLQSLGLVIQGLQAQVRRPGGLGAIEPATMARTLDTLLRQQRRLSRLIDALLDVTRLEAGRLHMELEPVDLADVVHDVVDLFRGELAQARCDLTLQVTGPLVGRWDRGRLEQVVANLLSNAAKYGAGRPVELTLARDGPVARLSVRDHGIGMDPPTVRQIFQRFKRGVSARHYGGLGLGLFIARQIVEALGGSIRVESAPGLGSTFSVELPLVGPHEHGGSPP